MLRDTRNIGPRTLVYNSNLYYWDITRNTWVSVGRQNISFGIDHKNLSYKRYMAMTGKVFSNTSGYRLIRDAMITAVSANTQGTANCKFNIRKNGGTDVTTVELTGAAGTVEDNLSILLEKGDWIQAEIDFNNTGDKANFPEICVEIAWRYDAS